MTFITRHSTHPKATPVTGTEDGLHVEFVRKLGEQLRNEDGLAYDPFDRDDTAYVAATDDHGALVGTARLLPTTRPYLLNTVFPALLHGLAPPASPQVWELSRLAAPDFDASLTRVVGWHPAPVAVGLLNSALRSAAALGAERVIAVSPLGLERLLLRSGFRAHRAAPPLLVQGHPLSACWIECC
jgi:N-acyl-L-homoserine lactone synthetase